MVRGLAAVFTGFLLSAPVFGDPLDGDRVVLNARSVVIPAVSADVETRVAVVGYLPSGCYQLLLPEVSVNYDDRRVRVTPQGRYFDRPCPEALVPYTFEVNIGHLSGGDYTLEVPTAAGVLRETIFVEPR